MTKSGLIIAVLGIFLLLGTISIAMGAADGIYTTKIDGLLPDGYGNPSSQAFINALPTPNNVLINQSSEYSTFNTLNSAYLENRDCRIVISNGEIRAAWFFNDPIIDVNEPQPISVNIPEGPSGDHLFEGTVRNMYSSPTIGKGSMAYIIVQNNQRTINGWVRLGGKRELLNIYNILNSASLTNKNVVVAVHSLPGGTFITGTWYK